MTKRNGKDPFNPNMFSLSDFRKWMEQHQEDVSAENNFVGEKVEPIIGLRKLISKIETDDDAHDLAMEFRKHGGVVNEIDGKNLLIEVKSGTFVLSRNYVKLKD